MLFCNNNFDLILSLGRDCACSTYLRKFGLQTESYPFDWLTVAPMATRIGLLMNNFENFLLKENMKYIPRDPNTKVFDTKCDDYEDLGTKFHFYHDFPVGMDFDQAYKIVKERYQRRITRLYKHISKSKKILFVWFDRGENPTEESLKLYKKQLDEKFPNKKIYLLVLQNETEQQKFLEDIIQKDIIRVRYDTLKYDKNIPKNECIGNTPLNDKLFVNLKLSIPIEEKIKKIIFNLIIKYPSFLILNKQKRRLFRENLKQVIFHNN